MTIALLKTVAAKEVVSQSLACEHKLYCVTKNVSKTGDVRSCFNDADTQVLARQQLSKKQTNKETTNKRSFTVVKALSSGIRYHGAKKNMFINTRQFILRVG